jgi:class 3 adenylate cyclase
LDFKENEATISFLDDLPNRSSSIINMSGRQNNSEFCVSDNQSFKEISFSGQVTDCCICFIDMINSTKIVNKLTQKLVRKYYSIFLNSTAIIVKNFDSTIIKNAGDCLIYYFPNTNNVTNENSFKNMIECNLTIISAHDVINSKLYEENLPPLDYRISADYGEVQLAKSTSSQRDDLFGSAINVCAKINPKAPPNTFIIGEKLYGIVKSFNNYNFQENGKYDIFKATENDRHYSIYLVSDKQKRNIFNPFQRVFNPEQSV